MKYICLQANITQERRVGLVKEFLEDGYSKESVSKHSGRWKFFSGRGVHEAQWG